MQTFHIMGFILLLCGVAIFVIGLSAPHEETEMPELPDFKKALQRYALLIGLMGIGIYWLII